MSFNKDLHVSADEDDSGPGDPASIKKAFVKSFAKVREVNETIKETRESNSKLSSSMLEKQKVNADNDAFDKGQAYRKSHK